MFKCLALTVAAILYAECAFPCSMVTPPIRAFDPGFYIFTGTIVEVLENVPYLSGGFEDHGVGFRVRVTQLIHPYRKAGDRGRLYFDVFPLQLTATCNLRSDVEGLRTRFAIGNEVRVIATTAKVFTEPARARAPLRLETDDGSLSRNDLRNDLRTSATTVYAYRTWGSHPARTSTDDAVVASFHGLLEFELWKDLLRLQTSRKESDRISILRRLAFYPHIHHLDLPAAARSAIKHKRTLAALERLWTQRLEELRASFRIPDPPPDPEIRKPQLGGLLTHLKVWPPGEASESTRHLIAYLDGRPENDDPLAALIEWFKAGFPELRDQNGIFKISSHSVQWDFVSSLGYFIERLPAAVRTARFLEVLDAVKTDSYIAWQLMRGAGAYLEPKELKESSFRLMNSSDVSQRRHGAEMVCRLSGTDDAVWKRCREALTSDEHDWMRSTVLSSMPLVQDLSPLRRQELVTLQLQAFLTDSSKDVREAAGRHVAIYADDAAVRQFPETPSVLARILVSLAETTDSPTRERLAGFAAKATIKRPFRANETIPTAALVTFLERVERQGAAKPGAEELIVRLWLDWWPSVMRDHSTRVY